MVLKGFRGELAETPPEAKPGPRPATKDIDLVHMARLSLNYLAHNPRPNLDYNCRFDFSLLRYPPCSGPEKYETYGSTGDGDSRMDWEYLYMKGMCGDASADEAARGVRRRILGYLKEDGFCWFAGKNVWNPDVDPYAMPWATGKLLVSLCEDYLRTGDPKSKSHCRRIFEALRGRADWVDGRAFYLGGNGIFTSDGWHLDDNSPYHPAMILEPVVRYYEAFKEQEALDFAIAFAEGEMADDQWWNGIYQNPEKMDPAMRKCVEAQPSLAPWWPGKAPAELGGMAVRDDGSFDHHSHMRGHLGWGMAHLGAITREPRLVQWSKRLLDFFLSRGTDFGWIPESMSVPQRSETCAVSDVISIASWVARSGYPEYWEVVERFVRNYIREAQFFSTDEYENLYRKLHPGEEGEIGLAMTRDVQGGFQGGMGVNSRLCYGFQNIVMDMMGCCAPEGMRALYTAWSNAIEHRPDGVCINMCFDRDAPEAAVVSLLPYEGGMRVKAKTPGGYRLRPPAWAARDKMMLRKNGKALPLLWRGDYLCADGLRASDTLEVTYPLPSFAQRQTVPGAGGVADRDLSVSWLGNTVTNLEPAGEILPLYADAPRELPERLSVR